MAHLKLRQDYINTSNKQKEINETLNLEIFFSLCILSIGVTIHSHDLKCFLFAKCMSPDLIALLKPRPTYQVPVEDFSLAVFLLYQN